MKITHKTVFSIGVILKKIKSPIFYWFYLSIKPIQLLSLILIHICQLYMIKYKSQNISHSVNDRNKIKLVKDKKNHDIIWLNGSNTTWCWYIDFLAYLIFDRLSGGSNIKIAKRQQMDLFGVANIWHVIGQIT